MSEFLSLAWWHMRVDPRITSAEVKAFQHGAIDVAVWWHENFIGGFHCRAALHGEGASFEDAVANLHGSAEDGDPRERGTLAERFQASADWYAKDKRIRFDFDQGEVEELDRLERALRAVQLKAANESQRKIDDHVFGLLAKRGYTFRFKSCAPFDALPRDDRGRIVAVEVIDAAAGEALERQWAESARARGGAP